MQVKDKCTKVVHEMDELLTHWQDNEFVGKAFCGVVITDLYCSLVTDAVTCKACMEHEDT